MDELEENILIIRVEVLVLRVGVIRWLSPSYIVLCWCNFILSDVLQAAWSRN